MGSLAVRTRHALKRIAYALMPAALQESIDRRFYYRRLASGSLSEEAEFALLPALVRSGEVALDVGANLGGYTIALSRLVGPTGQVHAFEPIPRTFRLLTHNVRRLAPFPNVLLYELAADNRTSRTTMSIPLERSLANYYVASLARRSADPVKTIEVSVTSLDAWEPPACGHIGFLKIDVEGAEWNVLDGARSLLERHRPLVLCELGDSVRLFGHSQQDVLSLVAGLGYTAYRFRHGRLRRASAPDGLPLPNYVFAPSDRHERLLPYLAAGEL